MAAIRRNNKQSHSIELPWSRKTTYLCFKKCALLFFLIYFQLCWVSDAAHGLSLVVVSRGYSLAVVHGLLIVVASLVAEHRL